MFAIEVINRSSFPVTITEFGFELEGTSKRAVPTAQFIDGGSLPRRLDSREALTAYFDTGDLFDVKQQGFQLRRAFVSTACGVTARGSSPALRQVRDEMAKA